jgi:3-phosphoglycerate kinase
MKKKSVRDLTDAEIRGKRALVRVDFNVPLDDDCVITDAHSRGAADD